MLIIIIAISAFPAFFLVGFLMQSLAEKIEENKKQEKTSAVNVIKTIFKLFYWECRIKLLSFFFEKEKRYLVEMKKTLKLPYIENSFKELLVMEKKRKHIWNIIAVVLQKQERNRRIKDNEGGFFYQNFFLIEYHFLKSGPQEGKRVVNYYYTYVLNAKYLRGYTLPLDEAEITMMTFGSEDEIKAIQYEYSLKIEEMYKEAKYYDLREKEAFSNRMNKMRGESI